MSLNIILGPVFSGKTTELVRHGRRYSSLGWSILYVTPRKSNAAGSSHAQLIWNDYISVDSLIEINDKTSNKFRIILIDDCHFLSDDLGRVLDWVKEKKEVWVAGLDSDSFGNAYKDFLSWIPKSDKVKKLTALIPKDFSEANISFNCHDSNNDNTDADKILQLSPKDDSESNMIHRSSKLVNYRAGRFLGQLSIIFGPMFAGKTTELLRQATRYFHAGATILFINHEWNARYGTVEICSHDGVKASHQTFNSPRVHFMRTGYLRSIPQGDDNPIWGKIDVIFIEEGQFFPDILHVKEWIHLGKKVFISGLDGDARQLPFGDLYLLTPWATHLEKHCALCKRCGDGTPAPFTRKYTEQTDDTQVEVGSSDKYEAVCRYHFD